MNNYKIQFELTKQFAIIDRRLRFNIFNQNNELVGGLRDSLTCEFGTISSYPSGYIYELTLTNLKEGDDIPDRLMEEVRILLDSEDISEYSNSCNICYLYKVHPEVNLYIGESSYQSWNPGTITITDDHDIFLAEDAIIVGLSEGISSCNFTYKLGDLEETLYDVKVTVRSPKISRVAVSEVSFDKAKLTTIVIPNNPTKVKFRYGLANGFDPLNDTTYIEVEGTKDELGNIYTYTINDLDPNCYYKCQSVMYMYGSEYLNDYVEFRTKDISSGDIIFNREYLDLITSPTYIESVAATFDKVNENSKVQWRIISDLLDWYEGVENEITINLRSSKVVTNISSEIDRLKVRVIVNEILDGKVIYTHTGILPVNLYNVINRVDLYIDSTIGSSKKLEFNSLVVYNEITPDEYQGLLYDYNLEDHSLTAIGEGNAKLVANITIEGTEIMDQDYDINLNIQEVFVFPPEGLNDDTLFDMIKVFHYESEMYFSYPGVEFKTLKLKDNGTPVFYCFRTNNPSEIKWEYDICMLSTFISKYNVMDLIEKIE